MRAFFEVHAVTDYGTVKSVALAPVWFSTDEHPDGVPETDPAFETPTTSHKGTPITWLKEIRGEAPKQGSLVVMEISTAEIPPGADVESL